MRFKQKTTKKTASPITIVQTVVLTFLYFVDNNLYPYALACSFGLLYSAIPLLLLLLMILLRILQHIPTFMTQVENFLGYFFDIAPFQDTINNFFSSMTTSNIFFEIFIALIILWLARRFFITTMGCVHRIFHTQSTQQPLWIQVVASIAEIASVLILALIIFISTFLRSALDSSFINTYFPEIHKIISPFLAGLLPIGIIYLIIVAIYRYGSGTHPKWKSCFLAATACISTFIIIQIIFAVTLNIDRYSLIYGILAQIIIALFELSFFFSFFLFFAQMLFIVQFFDYLLLAELYLMPEHDDASILGSLHRMVFINPARFVTMPEDIEENSPQEKDSFFSLTSGDYKPKTEYYKASEIIYKEGDTDHDVYYIIKGSVELYKTNHLLIKDRGSSFGETSFLLDIPREHTALAKTDTTILRISEHAFSELLTRNPQAATKALAKISPRFRNIYPGLRTLT